MRRIRLVGGLRASGTTDLACRAQAFPRDRSPSPAASGAPMIFLPDMRSTIRTGKQHLRNPTVKQDFHGSSRNASSYSVISSKSLGFDIGCMDGGTDRVREAELPDDRPSPPCSSHPPPDVALPPCGFQPVHRPLLEPITTNSPRSRRLVDCGQLSHRCCAPVSARRSSACIFGPSRGGRVRSGQPSARIRADRHGRIGHGTRRRPCRSSGPAGTWSSH